MSAIEPGRTPVRDTVGTVPSRHPWQHHTLRLTVLLVAATSSAHALDYSASLAPDDGHLVMRACGGVDGTLELRAHAAAARHLVGVVRDDAAPVRVEGARIIAADWRAGDCLTYRVDLDAASADVRGRARLDESIWLLAPSDWLWREHPARAATLDLALDEGWHASPPWTPVSADPVTYRLPARTGGSGALTAFGRYAHRSIAHPGGRIDLAVLATPGSALADRLLAWQTEASGFATVVNGRLPLPFAQILVMPTAAAGDPVPWAQSNRAGGVALHFHVDERASLARLRADWTAAHEYAHLFHPWLGREGSWLAEGLASYYQNVMRARAGLLTQAQAWRLLYAGFGRGRDARMGTPLARASGDMRAQRNFMRIYWSGAAFWLEADIALRNSGIVGASVDAALARFSQCCLPQTRAWSPVDFIAELDRGLGTTRLVPLFERYRQRMDFPDLDAASRALGLDAVSGAFDPEAAPARIALRDAIMAAVPGTSADPAGR